jgi:hypothetical protein
VFVREASMVPVYAMLLFGGEIAVKHEQGLLQLDGWVLKAPARIAVLARRAAARSQCCRVCSRPRACMLP